jgi:hypothetical protein
MTTPRYFQLGDLSFELHFHGQIDTSFFCDAWAHLEKNTTSPKALKINIIDQKTSGMLLPKELIEWENIDPYSGDLLNFKEGFVANCNTFNQVFTWIDYTQHEATLWHADVTILPAYERSFPLRRFFYSWFKDSHYSLVHAGAVGYAEGGVLLAGKGGTGKSTTTMACLDSSLRYAGDDFVLISPQTPTAYSLYNVAKLEEKNLRLFPDLAPHVNNWDEVEVDKAQLFLWQFAPQKLIPSFPIKAIVLPKFTGQPDTIVRPASSKDAMQALMPSSILLLRTNTQQITKIANLVRQLPAYWLETGTDLAQIPRAIEKILTGIISHKR